jgi:hypothetical protein
MTIVTAFSVPSFQLGSPPMDVAPTVTAPSSRPARGGPIRAAVDPDDGEDDDLGDEEDLAVAQPLADEESSFDDFDDEFDDDFEEEENDPDWDHPDDGDNDALPPGKNPGRKK